MPSRRSTRRIGVRLLGIIPLILGLGHTPLPVADFHNIRHHDSPGQVCTYHDHLLRWHPGAGSAEDVAILHWHWFLLLGDTDSFPPDEGPAIHAHLADPLNPSWDDAPRIALESPARVVERGGTGMAPDTPTPRDLGGFPGRWPSRAGPASPVHAFTATFPPRVGLPLLLQRWTC